MNTCMNAVVRICKITCNKNVTLYKVLLAFQLYAMHSHNSLTNTILFDLKYTHFSPMWLKVELVFSGGNK